MMRAETESDPRYNPDGLTRRQIEVLRLYGDGLCTKQIARRLYISEKGVDYHRGKLFEIMKFKSFAHLVKTAVAFGLTSLCLALYAGTVNLVWTNPNGPGLGVNIYYTTNVSMPTNQWPLLAYLTNSPPGANSFVTNLPPANYFFVAAFTNSFWGLESFFSNGAATPSLPTNLLTGFTVLNH